jgi:hypothetical protein
MKKASTMISFLGVSPFAPKKKDMQIEAINKGLGLCRHLRRRTCSNPSKT